MAGLVAGWLVAAGWWRLAGGGWLVGVWLVGVWLVAVVCLSPRPDGVWGTRVGLADVAVLSRVPEAGV